MPVFPEPTPRRGITLPPTGGLLVLLLAAYILPGLVGHDPWKVEDATAFGVVFDILQRGTWLTPGLAGEAFPDAPLYYWIAAGFAQAFSWLLPLPDAVRLTSGACTFLIFVFAYLAARDWYGKASAIAAPLILAGCIGFLVHAHDTQPVLLSLAAYFAAFWALALLERQPWKAGIILGAALGLGTLANGPGMMLPALLLTTVALVLAENKGAASRALGVAVLTAILITLTWLAPLAAIAPEYLSLWWAAEKGQWAEFEQAGTKAFEFLKLLPWYAWPALPLAGWTLWIKRRTLTTPALLLPVFGFFAALACLAFLGQARNVQALLLLPPLTLLAVPGIASLRRGAAKIGRASCRERV